MKTICRIRRIILALLILGMTGLVQAQYLDQGFKPQVDGGEVLALAQVPGGGIVLAGEFGQVDGVSRSRIALLGGDGALDPGFDPAVNNGAVLDLLVDRQGEIVLVGSFTSAVDGTRPYFMRVDTQGNASATLFVNPTPNGPVTAVAEDPETERLYIAGSFSSVGGQPRAGIARINRAGTLDASFVPPAFTGQIHAVAVQPDGKLLVAGTIRRPGDASARRIYRLNSDGSWDSSFVVSAVTAGEVRSLAVQLDGKVLAGGSFPGYLRRLTSNGGLDASYAPPTFNGDINQIRLMPDGRAVMVGGFTGPGPRQHVVRLNEDGSPDTQFAPLLYPNKDVETALVLSTGAVVLGGGFDDTSLGQGVKGLLRIAREGWLEEGGFIDHIVGGIGSIAVAHNDRVLVGGTFSQIGAVNQSYLARLLENGTVDQSFAPDVQGPVTALAVQLDGRVLVGRDRRLERFHPDGARDLAFSVPPGSVGTPQAILFDRLGRILLVVQVQAVGATQQLAIIRLLPDGTVDASFSQTSFERTPEGFHTVRSVALDDLDRIWVGGTFTTVAGQPRAYLARLLPDGAIDTSFSPTLDGPVYKLTRVGEQIVLNGLFSEVNGQPRSNLAAFVIQTSQLSAAWNFQGVPGAPQIERQDGLVYSTGAVRLFTQLGQASDQGDYYLDPPLAGKTWLALSDGRLAAVGSASSGLGPLVKVRPPGGVDHELTLDVDSGELRLRFHSDSIAPQVPAGTAPQVLLSYTCCDPASFQPLPGGSAMTRIAANEWVLADMGPVYGPFYLQIAWQGRTIAEYSNWQITGHSAYWLRTPIKQFHRPLPAVMSDIQVRAAVSPESVNLGDSVTFEINLINDGPSTASQVMVDVPLPDGYAYLGHYADDGNYDPVSGSWLDIPSLAAGHSLTLMIDAQPLIQGSYLLTAGASSNLYDPDPDNNLASVEPTVIQVEADLEILGQAFPAKPLVGEQAQWEFQVTNQGPVTATNAWVQLELPIFPFVELVSFEVERGEFDPETGIWLLPAELPPGAGGTLSIVYKGLDIGIRAINATIVGDQRDPDLGNNEVSPMVQFTQLTDVAIVGSVTPATAQVGDIVTYTYQFLNYSSVASNVAASNLLPDGVNHISHTHSFPPGAIYSPAQDRWSKPIVYNSGGFTLSIEIVGVVLASGTLINEAVITADQPDPDLSNNTAIVVLSVEADDADLAVSVSASSTQVEIGEALALQVHLDNLGPGTASGIVVDAGLPPGLDYNVHTLDWGSYDPSTGLWQVSYLHPDGDPAPTTAMLSITAYPSEAGPLTFSVIAGATETDPDLSNNQAEITIQVGAPPSDDQIFSDRFRTKP